jgi:hypothetical protein
LTGQEEIFKMLEINKMREVSLRFFYLCVLFFASSAHAFVPPASNVSNAVSGTIQQAMAKKGIQPSDARWGATLAQASTAIAAASLSAAAVTAAGVTAPAWVTAGAVMGLTALAGVAIEAAVDWIFNPDGTVTDKNAAPVPDVPTMPSGVQDFAASGKCWFKWGNWSDCAKSLSVAAEAVKPGLGYPIKCNEGPCSLKVVSSSGSNGAWVEYKRIDTGFTINIEFIQGNIPPAAQTAFDAGCGGFVKSGSCTTVNLPTKPSPPQTFSDAIDKLSEPQKQQELSDETIRKIADEAWRRAAMQPGYQGVPYSPVTVEDAQTQKQRQPDWPKIKDAVKPQPLSTDFDLPNFNAPTPVDPNVGQPPTPVVTSPTNPLDFGIPNMPSTIPKEQKTVTYTPTIFSSATGCPAPISFQMFNKQYVIEYTPFCDMMVTLSSIFLMIGAATAALIFADSLRAS